MDSARPTFTADDIANAYALFLGRVPPRDADRSRTDFAEWLGDLLSGDEFRSGPLSAVMLGTALPAGRYPDELPLKLIHWVQERLPLEPATRVTCGHARDWFALLEIVLSDAALCARVPGFREAGVDRVLGERVASNRAWRARHSVLGAVDSASAFEIRGWAVDLCDRAEPVVLEFYADRVPLGSIRCNEPRPDVADVIGGDGAVGFSFRLPAGQRAAFSGGAVLTAVDTRLRQPIAPGVVVHGDAAHDWDTLAAARRELKRMREAIERIEAQLPDLTRMASVPLEAYDEYWRRFYQLGPDLLREQREAAERFDYRPRVSVLLPAYRSDPRWLEAAIASVRAQSYPHWELVVSVDAADGGLEPVRRRHLDEARVRWIESETQGGIAANTNRALAAAGGDYVAFLDHDDMLAGDALFEIVARLQVRRYVLLYSDEDRIEDDEYGERIHHTPFFKPDFDPDLLLGMNYICHLVVAERQALLDIGGLRPRFDGAQDHDLLLRLARHAGADNIAHVARILYHWRVAPGSVSRDPAREERIRQAIVEVVDDHLRASHQDAAGEPHDDPVGRPRLFATRVRWRLPRSAPKVSIAIPTRDRLDLLEPCVASVLDAASHYPGATELLILDNDSVAAETRAFFARVVSRPGMRVIAAPGAFNWSAINNQAAREATGEVLIFLNNDTAVLTPDWCAELVAHAMRPEVGAVGARLLYGDGTIQHAGVVMGIEGVAGHEAVGETPATGGYFGRTHLLRSVSAVTGACLATRRALFLELGGFDELHLRVAFNDIDFCMRLRDAGYRIVYNPFAVLYHYESKSRGREITAAQQARHRSEGGVLRARWGARLGRDPYYNPHFELYARPFERLRPPGDGAA